MTKPTWDSTPRVPLRGASESTHPDLVALLRALYPAGTAAPASGHSPQAAPSGYRLADAFVAVPDVIRPRFLVPAGAPRAVASTLTAYIRLRPTRARAQRRAVALLARTRLLGNYVGTPVRMFVPTTDGPAAPCFTDHLRHILDAPRALAGLGIGKVDAHYKPTVQLFTEAGTAAGFAKLGWTAPTAELVERETRALRRWHSSPKTVQGVTAPAVLGSGTWNATPFLVTEPLPATVRRTQANDPLPDSARRIAGRPQDAHLADSVYWQRVRSRLAAAPATDDIAVALHRAVAVVEDAAGDAPWRFGRWHGDWVPWNVGRDGAEVHAWDWEHSTADAPWGFDLLHWQITTPHLRTGDDYRVCVAKALQHAQLPGVQVDRTTVVLAYLIEMGLRTLELRSLSTGQSDLYPGLTDSVAGLVAAISTG